jgi:hypothetical protein
MKPLVLPPIQRTNALPPVHRSSRRPLGAVQLRPLRRQMPSLLGPPPPPARPPWSVALQPRPAPGRMLLWRQVGPHRGPRSSPGGPRSTETRYDRVRTDGCRADEMRHRHNVVAAGPELASRGLRGRRGLFGDLDYRNDDRHCLENGDVGHENKRLSAPADELVWRPVPLPVKPTQQTRKRFPACQPTCKNRRKFALSLL